MLFCRVTTKKIPFARNLRANGIPHVLLCRSLCNYFLQTLKNKRRRQNKFGVAALFRRFTTKRIPFARNLRANGIPHVLLCRSLCNYFLQTLKNKRRRQNKFGVAALFLVNSLFMH